MVLKEIVKKAIEKICYLQNKAITDLIESGSAYKDLHFYIYPGLDKEIVYDKIRKIGYIIRYPKMLQFEMEFFNSELTQEDVVISYHEGHYDPFMVWNEPNGAKTLE